MTIAAHRHCCNASGDVGRVFLVEECAQPIAATEAAIDELQSQPHKVKRALLSSAEVGYRPGTLKTNPHILPAWQ